MKIKKIPLQFWIFGKGTYFTKISVMSIENGVVYVYLRSASFVSEFAIIIFFARYIISVDVYFFYSIFVVVRRKKHCPSFFSAGEH